MACVLSALYNIELWNNKIGIVHVTYGCCLFMSCLYLLDGPNRLIPFQLKTAPLWQLTSLATIKHAFVPCEVLIVFAQC